MCSQSKNMGKTDIAHTKLLTFFSLFQMGADTMKYNAAPRFWCMTDPPLPSHVHVDSIHILYFFGHNRIRPSDFSFSLTLFVRCLMYFITLKMVSALTHSANMFTIYQSVVGATQRLYVTHFSLVLLHFLLSFRFIALFLFLNFPHM